MKKLFLIFGIIPVFNYAQTKTDTTRIATYSIKENGNEVTFTPIMPVQVQIAGAPKASYSYFWEFGDGDYSKESNPKHIYATNGEFTTNLSVMAKYDDGSLPPLKPRPKPKPKAFANQNNNYIAMQGLSFKDTLAIFCDKAPIPNNEIVVVIRYRNPSTAMNKGKLYLFYNENSFKNNNFECIETRSHHGEREIISDLAYQSNNESADGMLASISEITTKVNNLKNETLLNTLINARTTFKDSKQFQLQNLAANKTNNLFFSFKTTPEMIKDTSAIVKIQAIFIPDENQNNYSSKTLEMEIVTSHDPNKMSNNGTFINYRLVRYKRINFKTRFQNDGEGPAKTIRLETEIPYMFDKKTLQIEDLYPKCPICPKNKEVKYSCLDTIIKPKQIHFTFKNIHLPGSNQKNVKEKDSTQGFVKYSLKFGDDFHKIKTKSKTSIFFDKNEAVVTNYSTTRFQPGISIGARAGYNFIPKYENAKSFFVGATVSPFKSYRWYWQSEFYFNYSENSNSRVKESIFNGITTQDEINQKTIQYIAEIVPISIRYNVNNFIGLGTGPQLSMLFAQKINHERTKKMFNDIGVEIIDERITENFSEKNNSIQLQTQWFADVTFGFARIGPSVGFRYLRNFKTDIDTYQLYAIWKF
jgi:hypothetical protein